MQHALHDRVRRRWRAAIHFAPIVRVDARADDDVAHGLRYGKHLNFAGRFRLMINSVRRAEEERLDSQAAFQKQFGEIQFDLQL